MANNHVYAVVPLNLEAFEAQVKHFGRGDQPLFTKKEHAQVLANELTGDGEEWGVYDYFVI